VTIFKIAPLLFSKPTLFSPGFARVDKLYLTRDSKGLMDDWYCDYIIVQDPRFARLQKHRKIKNLRNPGTVTTASDIDGPKVKLVKFMQNI